MEVTMYDSAAELHSNKRVRGKGVSEYINAFMESDEEAMTLNCGTVNKAHTVNVGIRNMSKAKNLKLTVWRSKAIVYVKKEDV